MSFRTKLLLACLVLTLTPLAFFGVRAREDVAARTRAEYAARVAALAGTIEQDLVREAAAVEARLASIADAAAADNALRRAVQGAPEERAALLDYAGTAMRLAGLDVLRIQDASGRILSSGHFRNEYDVVDPVLPAAFVRAPGQPLLIEVPMADGVTLALARAQALRIGTRTLTLIGGTAVQGSFLDRLAGATGLSVTLEEGSGAGSLEDPLVREIPLALEGAGGSGAARIVVRAPTAPLEQALAALDRWLIAAMTLAGLLAVLLSLVAAQRFARPIAELAAKAARLDVDALDVSFDSPRRDEIGALARVLDATTRRLRASAARALAAERRAATGDLARQVNHDVRNGIIPMRNVLGHLGRVARDEPEKLKDVFLEREQTLLSSVAYLHSLATNYARLAPVAQPGPCDAGAIVRDSASGVQGVTVAVDDDLPPVHGDPVALRRVVDNLVANARESLGDGGGRVSVSARRGRDVIVLEVADTGRGMTADEREKMFDDFFTTKPGGSGLGLSIVRRLVGDMGGRIRAESSLGRGTRITIELPVIHAAAEAGR